MRVETRKDIPDKVDSNFIAKRNLKILFNMKIKYPLQRRFKKSNFETFAKREFQIMKKSGKDYLILPYEKEIRKIVKKYSRSNQSGGSNPFTSGAISSSIRDLLRFNPVSPIYEDEDIWNEPLGKRKVQQCQRLSSLFKEPSGEAYYLNAIVFRDIDDGFTFTGTVEDVKSSHYVNFPFTPRTFYIDVKEEKDDLLEDYEEKELEEYNYKIVDRSQLEDVWKFYRKK